MMHKQSRREFLREIGVLTSLVAGTRLLTVFAASPVPLARRHLADDRTAHRYAILFDPERCIGCGHCVEACKAENDVPREPIYFRTWLERYIIKTDGDARVDSPNGGIEGFSVDVPGNEIFRSFFVPKTCNHCSRPPCVQVCPVGATYQTKEGVVLVDQDYCLGCRYCIQACPYGARYFHPQKRVADKCTFCYHRVTRGLRPACVEVCPRNVRIYGDLRDPESEIVTMLRRHPIQVLKPNLHTEPNAYYLNLDKEVR